MTIKKIFYVPLDVLTAKRKRMPERYIAREFVTSTARHNVACYKSNYTCTRLWHEAKILRPPRYCKTKLRAYH